MKTTLSLDRVRAFFKARKGKADDNIERSEPETVIAVSQYYVFGVIMVALWMMVAYAFMTDQLDAWIVSVLNTMDGTFQERYAILTSVLVVFSDALVIIGVAMAHEPTTGDVVDVVNDQSDEINDRFVEMEDRIIERLDSIERNM